MIKKFKQFDIPKPEEDIFNGDFELQQANILRTAKQVVSDSRVGGQYFEGNHVVRGVQSTGYSSVTVFDVNGPGFCQIRTFIDVGDATVRMNGAGRRGQELYLKIDNDTDANRTITFGDTFKVTGTLTGSTAASAILHFISDSTAFWEVSRTTGLNQ